MSEKIPNIHWVDTSGALRTSNIEPGAITYVNWATNPPEAGDKDNTVLEQGERGMYTYGNRGTFEGKTNDELRGMTPNQVYNHVWAGQMDMTTFMRWLDIEIAKAEGRSGEDNSYDYEGEA